MSQTFVHLEIFTWRRKWQPTPVFLPGKADGQRILAGHGPWDHKELNATLRLNSNNNVNSSQHVRTKSCKELEFGAEAKILLLADVIVYLEKTK